MTTASATTAFWASVTVPWMAPLNCAAAGRGAELQQDQGRAVSVDEGWPWQVSSAAEHTTSSAAEATLHPWDERANKFEQGDKSGRPASKLV